MILGGRPSKASPVGPSGSSTRTVRCVSEVREGRVEAFFGVFVVRSGLFIFLVAMDCRRCCREDDVVLLVTELTDLCRVMMRLGGVVVVAEGRRLMVS